LVLASAPMRKSALQFSYTLAFFDKYLRGMKPALLDQPPTSEFIEEVQRFQPAKFPRPTQ